MDICEVKQLLEGLDEDFTQFKRANTDRIDELEATLDGMDVVVSNATRPENRPYHTLFTDSGQKAFVVGRDQNLADIPDLQAKTEISLDRWVNALIFGSDCEDQAALE